MTEGIDQPLARPHRTRRQHQAALGRARRRQRQRRLARVRRIRFWKGVRSARFWSRTATGFTILLAIGFWSKYAFVYDIPTYAHRGRLSHVSMYVTLKPWWFGPPVFDVKGFETNGDEPVDNNTAYSILLDKMGKYNDVLLNPTFVWQSP